MKTYILSTVAFVCLMCSCEKTENFALPLPGVSVVGQWMEVEPEGLAQFEGTTYVAMNLRADYSFQIHYKAWSDILRVDDPCRGIQDYYVKGTYNVTDKVIAFDGCFTDRDFTVCMAKCDGVIEFERSDKYEISDQTLVLNPDEHEMIRRVMVPR